MFDRKVFASAQNQHGFDDDMNVREPCRLRASRVKLGEHVVSNPIRIRPLNTRNLTTLLVVEILVQAIDQVLKGFQPIRGRPGPPAIADV